MRLARSIRIYGYAVGDQTSLSGDAIGRPYSRRGVGAVLDREHSACAGSCKLAVEQGKEVVYPHPGAGAHGRQGVVIERVGERAHRGTIGSQIDSRKRGVAEQVNATRRTGNVGQV